jgi:hypothetical protein
MGSSENGNTTVMLVCSEHNSSKFLRKEVNACGISAARALVDWLLKDTGLLFGKIKLYLKVCLFLRLVLILLEKSNINGTIRGQQGRQGDDGKFVLHVSKTNSRDLPQNTPTAPKAAGFKRQRTDHDGSGGRGQGRSQFGGESNIEPQEGLSYGEDEDRSMYMD